MIKKLQKKFIILTMGSLIAVMIIVIGLINGIYLIQMEHRINETIDILSNNQGKFPLFEKEKFPRREKPKFEINEETPFETRYFVVEVNADDSIQQIDTSHIAAVSSEDALEYAAKIMDDGRNSGYIDIYKFKITSQDNGSMIVFLDCRTKLQSAKTFLVISCMVAITTFFLMLLLITILSRRAIRPFVENAERQKLFITDAGHEIKTPLAIISANADVLELTCGENEWITSIRNQITRLDRLVKNLLTLSKMDEENIKLSFTQFNLSDLVAKVATSFEAMAEAKGKHIYQEISPGIKLNGDESSIEQLVSTLLDNAIKYSSVEGKIRLTLTYHKNGAKLEVYNTTENLDLQNLDKLFDRFYRTDASRSRETGGYGIGLSIAKSIVEAHNGKISVRSEDGNSICFTTIL